ncbi:PIN-like domain-containing protein [Shewanella algae]|uniref:PIN-like domain-containing protein n=1 Tax=Shewanella algae TaxID=38313 RepID=UPI00300552A2
MRTTFPWFYKKTEQDLKELFDKAVFVFDTNVLLNLYRYSDTTRNDLLNAMETLTGRSFLPHRVASEYFENRLFVIFDQQEAYDKTVKSIKTLKSEIDNTKQHPFVSKELQDRTGELFEELCSELDKWKGVHSDRFLNDEILDKVSNIFESAVAKPKTSDEINELARNGEGRYKERIPPGYMDESKVKSNAPLNQQLKAYGDYLIWEEILDYANSKKTDVIFITDDEKEDWWQIVKGKTIGPRPELIKEFFERTEKSFHMYTSHSFLLFAKSNMNLSVREESIHEVEELKFADSLLKYNVSGEGSAPEKSDRLNALEVYFDSDDSDVLNEFLRNDDFESILIWTVEEYDRFCYKLIVLSGEGLELLKSIERLSTKLMGFSMDERDARLFRKLRFQLPKAIHKYKNERSKYN